MGDCVESLAEVKVDNIHSSPSPSNQSEAVTALLYKPCFAD